MDEIEYIYDLTTKYCSSKYLYYIYMHVDIDICIMNTCMQKIICVYSTIWYDNVMFESVE